MGTLRSISGRGGKKGGSNAANTLQSNATSRFVDALSEGPIEGLVDGAKSIFFEETPIEAPNGSKNFENINWQYRAGNPDDDHLNGHNAIEQTVPVGTTVSTDVGPVSRTINNPDADAVRVIIRIDSLFRIDGGKTKTADLDYDIRLRSAGGEYDTVVEQRLTGEKCTSPVQMSHRIELPVGGHPWTVTVEKVTPDATKDTDQNSMTFESMVTLVEGRFTYPHTALIGMEVNAEDVGSSVPRRSYLIRGRQISVPSNYDPIARIYEGVWDGSFKQAWSNCPPWILYDILENDRYGLGSYLQDTELSSLKWQLYTIGQYCDQRIPSGFKDQDGNDVLEPRFTFNGVIQSRREAMRVVRSITATFRAMGYWSLGQVMVSADMPSDPVKIVTPANVINGENGFSYSSTSRKSRHSVAVVRWNNPENFYRPEVELVVNNEALAKYGWREMEIRHEGCTSRGLAHRFGKWALDVENTETETVTYKCGFDHMDILPGDIVAVADPQKANVRMGGRIASHSESTTNPGYDEIILDAETAFAEGEVYKIWLTGSNGELREHQISNIESDKKTLLILTTGSKSEVNSVFIVTGTDVAPVQYRVLGIDEVEPNIFQITALLHDPGKYDRIEQGLSFEATPFFRDISATASENLVAVERSFIDAEGVARNQVVLSWTAPKGVVVREYLVQIASEDEGKRFFTTTKNTTVDIGQLSRGNYEFFVTTIDRRGQVSAPATTSLQVTSSDAVSGGKVVNLTLKDDPGKTEFFGRDVSIAWQNMYPDTPGAEPNIEDPSVHDHNTVKVYHSPTNTLLRTVNVRSSEFTYSFDQNKVDSLGASLGVVAARHLRFEVVAVARNGSVSTSTALTVSNPVPSAIQPVVSVNAQTIAVSMPDGLDEDVKGMKVWIESDSGFDATQRVPRFSGAAGFMTWEGSPDQEYHVRAGYFDFFDDNVTLSSQVTISTEALTIVESPAVPTGLILSTELVANGISRVTAIWDLGPSSVSSYDLLVSENNGGEVGFSTSKNSYFWDVTSGTRVKVRLRAVATGAVPSTYTNTVEITAAVDSTPPSVPANVRAVSGFQTIWLEWDATPEEDLAYYEIFSSETNPGVIPSDLNDLDATTSTILPFFNLGDEVSRYLSVRAVDTSDNKSDWSEIVQGVTLGSVGVTTEAIQGLVDATSFATGMTGVEVVGVLPTYGNFEGRTVFLTTNGKTYRYHNGLWTAKVSASDVDGEIVETQISDDAITSPKIRAGEIGADHLGANSVVAGKIAAGAVNTDQLAANAVTAEKLLVGDTSNMVLNDFSTGNVDGWKLQHFDKIYQETDPNIGGWAVASKGRDQFTSRTISVSPEEHLYFSVWVYNQEGTGSANILVEQVNSDGEIISWLNVDGTTDKNNWRRLEGNIKLSTDAVGARMVLQVNQGSNGNYPVTNWARPVMQRANAGKLIVDGAITANHVGANEVITNSANIKDAVINDAKISDLSAAKLKAGTALAGSITVSGSALSDIRNQANNPAGRINQVSSTLIDPGRIQVSGSTTLANWRRGGDETRIDGGEISSNTIKANSLQIGNRMVTVTDVVFSHNGSNRVSWTAGIIRYIGDNGEFAFQSVSAGSYSGTTFRYIFWERGSDTLLTTGSSSAAMHPDKIILAHYHGGTRLVVNFGQTIIDGDHIQTGAIDARHVSADIIEAEHISSDAIKAEHISSDAIRAEHVAVNAIEAEHVKAGAISSTKLSVGSGGNLLRNSDLAEGLLGWEMGKSGDIGSNSIMSLRPPGDWSGQTYSVLSLRQIGTHQSGYADIRSVNFDASGNLDRRSIPVRELEWYEVSVQCSIHRTQLRLMVGWLRDDGSWIGHASHGQSGFADFTGIKSSLTNPDNWPRYRLKYRAPSGAAYAQVFFRNEGTTSGNDSYLFLHKPFFGETTENTTEAAPWTSGPKTVIDGSGIRVNSITAGMGLFNGPLRSTNYTPGVAGWNIDKNGSAEFLNLVAREWVRVGAVSDGVTVVNSSPRKVYKQSITKRYLGPITLDQFWQCAVFVRYRLYGHSPTGSAQGSNEADPSYDYTAYQTKPVVKIRYRKDGSWGAWSTIHEFPSADSSSWREGRYIFTVHGFYDDVQIELFSESYDRFRDRYDPNSGFTQNNIAEYSMVARALVR